MSPTIEMPDTTSATPQSHGTVWFCVIDPCTPIASSIMPALDSDKAVPPTRRTTAETGSACASELSTAPISATPTPADGDPSSSSAKANSQSGVTTPIGPNRIQVRGLRSQISSSAANTANAAPVHLERLEAKLGPHQEPCHRGTEQDDGATSPARSAACGWCRCVLPSMCRRDQGEGPSCLSTPNARRWIQEPLK